MAGIQQLMLALRRQSTPADPAALELVGGGNLQLYAGGLLQLYGATGSVSIDGSVLTAIPQLIAGQAVTSGRLDLYAGGTLELYAGDGLDLYGTESSPSSAINDLDGGTINDLNGEPILEI